MFLKNHLIFAIVFLFCLQFVVSMEEEQWDAQKMLDRYILDYMRRKNMHTTAEIFASEAQVGDEPVVINSPEGFLKEWWDIFYDVYMSRQQQGNATNIGESSSQANRENVEVGEGSSSQRNVEVGEGSSSQANMPNMPGMIQPQNNIGHHQMNYTMMPTPSEMNLPMIMGQFPNLSAFNPVEFDPHQIMNFEQFNQLMMMGQSVPSFLSGFNMMGQLPPFPEVNLMQQQGQPQQASMLSPVQMQDQANMNFNPFLDLEQLRRMLPSSSSSNPLQQQLQQHQQPPQQQHQQPPQQQHQQQSQNRPPQPIARENRRVLNLGRSIPRIPTPPRPRYDPSDAGKNKGVLPSGSTGRARSLSGGGSVSPAMASRGFYPFNPTPEQVRRFLAFSSEKGKSSAAAGSSRRNPITVGDEPSRKELAEKLPVEQPNAAETQAAREQPMNQVQERGQSEKSGSDAEEERPGDGNVETGEAAGVAQTKN